MIVSNDSLSFIRFILFHSISFHMMIILGELNIQQSMWLLWWAWKQKSPNQIKKTVEGASLGTSWGDFRLTLHGGSCNTAWWHCWTLSWECHTQDEPESVCRQRCSSAGKMQERPRRVPGGEVAELSLAWGRWDADRHLLVPHYWLVGCVLLHSGLWALGASVKAGTQRRCSAAQGYPQAFWNFTCLSCFFPPQGNERRAQRTPLLDPDHEETLPSPQSGLCASSDGDVLHQAAWPSWSSQLGFLLNQSP